MLLYHVEREGFRYWTAKPPQAEFDERLVKAKSFDVVPWKVGIVQGEFFSKEDIEWIHSQLEELVYQ